MKSPQDIANELAAVLPNVRSGTLRFWGQWFGRPFENGHRLVESYASGDCLRLRFDQHEVLTVWHPADVHISATTFRIGDAAALRWTWFYYGRPQTSENLRYLDYARQDGGILYCTNSDRLPGQGWLDGEAGSHPAVEMPDYSQA